MGVKRKALSALMAVALAAGLAPAPAWADPGAEASGRQDGTIISVSTAEEYSEAVETIEALPEGSEATVVLKGDVSPADDLKSTLGVAGKHVTYVSEDGQNYDLSTSTPHLVGDVTVQNVKVKDSSVFAEGHTLEFGEQYSGTGLRLYGGSDEDLDLTANGDADGSTHLIIRAGKFKSVVGGNKDTFTQGEYHEYADWSDPEENVHTTLTGDVRVDVYGGSFGGSYNIDVGDTCCNTDVTPCKLYGGGLGSDTVGDVTINVYGLDAASNYNCNIVGGGFGMAGGADDQTLYDDAIKHTGVVDGNVSLNLLGGNIAEFYGGGWHGGSAYKKQANVSSERAAQRQHHREEVAVVTGDVNIVMGGTMTLCQNQSQGWGGSYASTIEGDVNVTIKDEAKLAARYALNNGGAPTPQSMNDLDNTYAQYYDGMYTGAGWDSGFYACGQYDIICGSVSVDVQGGYAWNIQGTPFTDPFAELPVAKTEIRNEDNAPYGIDIAVSGGMVHDLWGDYEGGRIAGGIRYAQTGGEVFSVNVFDGRNSSLEAGSNVDVIMSGGVVYNMVGQYSRMHDGVTSTITFEPGVDADPVKLGYLVGFGQVTAAEGSNTLIDAVAVMDAYQIDPKKYGATSDVPFYENVYDLSVEKDALLTTCANETEISGDAMVTEGTWVAYGPVTIGESVSQSGGTVFLAQPSEVKGDAAFSGGAELRLPVVADNNYAGADNPAIPLRVDGMASGSCWVLTVDGTNWEQAKDPQVGDNYVVGLRDGDKPSQDVFVLANDTAVATGLYLGRTSDLASGAKDANYMWQVMQGEPAPAQVVTIRPQDMVAYTGGESLGGDSFPATRYEVTLSEGLDAADATFTVDGATYRLPADTESGDIVALPWLPDVFTLTDGSEMGGAESGEGQVATSDLVAGEYAVTVDGSKVSAAAGKKGVELELGSSTLTVRDVSEPEAVVASEKDVAQPVVSDAAQVDTSDGIGVAVIAEGTRFFTNGREELGLLGKTEDGDAKVSLLFDGLLPGEEGEDTAAVLRDRAARDGHELTAENSELRYLDLVNENDGNAWVSTEDGAQITVYWPVPEGVDPEDVEFSVLHFRGLHREYRGDLEQQVADCEIEEVECRVEGDNVAFTLTGSQDGGCFSPFALCWKESSSGPVTPPARQATLFYEENGGAAMADEAGPAGRTEDLEAPARVGWTFEGWYFDEALTEFAGMPGDGVYMGSDVTVWAKWSRTDVPSCLREDHVNYVVGRERADGSAWIEPLSEITRAEAAAVVFRLLDDGVRETEATLEEPYPDVSEGDWFAESVATLTAMGVLSGYPDGTFGPSDPISRSELAAMAARLDERFAGGAWSGEVPFGDVPEGHWAEEAIAFAANRGWLVGDGGAFRPEAPITRAETMAVFNRVLQRIPLAACDLLPGRLAWPDNADGSQWYWLDVEEATNAHSHATVEGAHGAHGPEGEGLGPHEAWTALEADVDWGAWREARA